MLQRVRVGHKALADYRHLIGPALVEEIGELSKALEGKRVLHVSATAMGGGVSEILYAMVPLMRDAGLDVEWHIVFGREEFFNVTKLLHNALQGSPHSLSDDDWQNFNRYNQINAGELDEGFDFYVIHDPQPLGLHRHVAERCGGKWIWRCHIDLSTPNLDALQQVVPLIHDYDAKVFHMQQYVPEGVDGHVAIVPPAIDPLSPKNMALSPEDAAFVCDQFGIDVDRPLICQVSRFDPWKDPLGVIDAYYDVRKRSQDVQLALVGSMATDDPEGWDFFQKTHEHAAGDPDIKILNNLNNVGAIEVNAFQSQADVVFQKSIREGFGLTVSEALWKARPMIAGNVGGIPLQIEDGESGFLIESSEQAADRCVEILSDPELGKHLGRSGKEHVRKHFLTPRLLRDWLKIFAELD